MYLFERNGAYPFKIWVTHHGILSVVYVRGVLKVCEGGAESM